MRSCKGSGEVREEGNGSGLRMTSARALEARKRRASGEEFSCCSSYLVQVKRSRGIAFTAENLDYPCASPCSHQAVSSCSKNASSHLAKDKLRTTDLQVEEEASSIGTATSVAYNIQRRERRGTTSTDLEAMTSELESTTDRPSEANPHRLSPEVKMPSDAELEDFFSAAERDLQKQFAQKYNFDIVKEEPLEGSFTWIRVTP